jgi:hypothetical protein
MLRRACCFKAFKCFAKTLMLHEDDTVHCYNSATSGNTCFAPVLPDVSAFRGSLSVPFFEAAKAGAYLSARVKKSTCVPEATNIWIDPAAYSAQQITVMSRGGERGLEHCSVRGDYSSPFENILQM